MPKLYQILGVAGVNPTEDQRAYVVESVIQYLMIGIAFWLLIQKYLLQMEYITLETSTAMRWFVWAFFVFETVVVTALCKRKWYFIKTNWLNLVIIVLAFPLFWEHGTEFGILRVARIIIILYLLMPLGRRSDRTFSSQQFGIILLMFTVCTLLAGLFLAFIDPTIVSPWQGIWWAFQTITTVGYGDVLPQTTGGRIFAIFFMLVGVGLLATLSASFAYFLLRKRGIDRTSEQKQKALAKQVDELQKSIDKLSKQLKNKK